MGEWKKNILQSLYEKTTYPEKFTEYITGIRREEYMDVREKGNDNELDDLITDISRHNLTQPSKETEKDSTPKVRRVSKKRKKNPPEEMPISPLPENNSVTTEALQYLQEASKKIRKLMKNLERNVTAQQYE